MKVVEEDCRLSSYAGGWRLLHWGPITAIIIILWIGIFTIYCDLMYWPIEQGATATANLCIFTTWVTLVLYNHFRAAAVGPGFVPLKWKPKKSSEKTDEVLQFCKICQGYKAPRSHHCRKCNRCVMKMDHHCPWINICCGHMNHANFTYFLLFAPIGCIHAMFILSMSLYYGLNVRYYLTYGRGAPIVIFNIWSLVGSMFALGLAFGVTISVGILFIMQFRGIYKNRTGIEDWIEQKASYRDLQDESDEFVYPYDVGCWSNIRQVLCRLDGWPESDGFWWSIRDGCDQYTLTTEQIKQKREKRDRAAECRIVKPYSGRFFPITHGCMVCWCFPWTDEERIKLEPGDVVMVTRWRKYWLYGDKVIKGQKHSTVDEEYQRIRGWFPRHCAVRVVDGDADGAHSNNKKQN